MRRNERVYLSVARRGNARQVIGIRCSAKSATLARAFFSRVRLVVFCYRDGALADCGDVATWEGWSGASDAGESIVGFRAGGARRADDAPGDHAGSSSAYSGISSMTPSLRAWA